MAISTTVGMNKATVIRDGMIITNGQGGHIDVRLNETTGASVAFVGTDADKFREFGMKLIELADAMDKEDNDATLGDDVTGEELKPLTNEPDGLDVEPFSYGYDVTAIKDHDASVHES